MKLISRRAWTLAAAILLTAGTGAAIAWQPPTDPAPATAPAKTTDGYTRVVEKNDGTLTLEIAAKTFTPAAGKAGPKVHLVGAVHIADKPFYDELQKMLDANDLVLFEGVKPPGAGTFDATLDNAGKIKATEARLHFLLSVLEENRARTGKLPDSLQEAVDEAGKRWKMMIASSLTDAWGRPIQYTIVSPDGESNAAAAAQKAIVTSLGADGASQDGKGDDVRAEGKAAPKKKVAKDAGLQAKMADALGLTFQLEAMDSSKPNWRSSDMSVDQLQARFEEAGVEGNQLFKMLDGSSFMGQIASFLLGMVKSSPTLATTLKLTMVDLLGSGEDTLGNAGPASMKKMMAVILKDRNDVVLKDLRSVIDTEKPAPKDVAIFYGAGHFGDMEAKLKKDFGYTLVSEQWLEAITVDPKAAGMSADQAKKMREMMKKQIDSQAAAAEKAEKAKAQKKRDENVQ